MSSLRRASCAVALAALAGAFAPDARGEVQPRVHANAGAARALGGVQEKETGFGPQGGGALEVGFLPEVGVQVEVGGALLGKGEAPADPTIAPRGTSGGATFMGGLRARPFAGAYRGRPVSPAGWWADANAGGARTGDLTRGAFDAHVGYDFLFEPMGVGPEVGYVHVFQPDATLRPDDARIVLVGVHGVYGTPHKPAPAAVAAPRDGDRDGDGIPDSRDKCPDDPEDKDGFEDEDGCPDPDNDKDGIPDVEDACPNVPGVHTNDPKTNGCPDDDRDKDGIPNALDKCPDDPEDKDGFEDEDGCPDLDNDQDGIPDATDQCPNEPETFNGYADEDGCPDEDQVRVVGDRILLDDRVHFETNRAVVLHRSWALLSRVAKLIKARPEYIHVQVEGYADERGEARYNERLSEARAQAVVDKLVEYGVERSRLSAVGFGATNPRVGGHDPKALRENRRVELAITRATGPAGAKPAGGAPGGGKPQAAKPEGAKPEAAKPGDAKPAAGGLR